MKSFTKSLVIGALAIAVASGAMAQEAKRSGQAEALALIKKAQEYIKANGLEKAYAEFNNLESPFNSKSAINPNGDLYVYNTDFNGLQLVHGKNPKIRGKVMIDMRDQEGVYIIKGLVDNCKSAAGKGWVDYKWPHPINKDLEPKSGYIERIPGTEQCIGTGIYK
jgi:hypothetical protein